MLLQKILHTRYIQKNDAAYLEQLRKESDTSEKYDCESIGI